MPSKVPCQALNVCVLALEGITCWQCQAVGNCQCRSMLKPLVTFGICRTLHVHLDPKSGKCDAWSGVTRCLVALLTVVMRVSKVAAAAAAAVLVLLV